MGSKIGEAKPPRKSIKMRIALILGLFLTLELCRSSPLTETTQGPISKEDVQKETEVDKIQATWSHRYHMPSEAELKTAAQLAQEGYLSTVEFLRIVDKDISEIPSDNIGKLSSIVIHEDVKHTVFDFYFFKLIKCNTRLTVKMVNTFNKSY